MVLNTLASSALTFVSSLLTGWLSCRAVSSLQYYWGTQRCSSVAAKCAAASRDALRCRRRLPPRGGHRGRYSGVSGQTTPAAASTARQGRPRDQLTSSRGRRKRRPSPPYLLCFVGHPDFHIRTSTRSKSPSPTAGIGRVHPAEADPEWAQGSQVRVAVGRARPRVKNNAASR